MKRMIFLLIPIMAFGINACEKNQDQTRVKGQLEFVMEAGMDGLKSAPSDTTSPSSYHLLLTVTDAQGVQVFEDKLLEVYRFGEGFVSEKLQIERGSYKLTKFMLTDPSGAVIYAAPIKGSPKSFLVNDPLPLPFSITAGKTTQIRPEVLKVIDGSPSDWGYASFGLQIVNPMQLFVVVMIDFGPAQITDAYLHIRSADGWNHRYYIKQEVSRILIKGGAQEYIFEVLKDGYEPVKRRFTLEQLKAVTQNNPLILRIKNGPLNVLKLKPGPEKGIDAMISDLDPGTNFGSWKYFEATFLSEPVLTVMRNNRSLIRFNMEELPQGTRIDKVLLTLYIDKPVGWPDDSLRMDSSIAWYGGVFRKIVEDWKENEVTWNNQPATTDSGQVFVRPRPELSTNMRTYDVTSLFTLPAYGPVQQDFGLMFQLYPSPQFPGFRFASSDYPEPALRPELKVYYSYLPD